MASTSGQDSQPAQASTAQNNDQHRKVIPITRLEVPKIRFCPECNNMLYPKVNNNEKVLVQFCRACLYQEKISRERYCTYVNTITHEINELSLIPSEMPEDPTLARTKSHPCPKCRGKEAVFMQGLLKESNEGMRLYYICCNSKCRFKWT